MTKRAIIYARVSTDDQRGNFSIPTQIAGCMKLIQDKDYALVGNQFVNLETGQDVSNGTGAIPAFVDDFSSRELNRPSLDAALIYLESFGYDVVIVHALDRLARDPYIRQTLENEFGRRGAKVEFVLGNYEESPEGEVRKDLEATFGKWENAKRVERCNRGKIGKAQKGQFVAGRAPYGYEIDPAAFGGLRVTEAQAQVVRYIFDLFASQNVSIRGIVEELNKIGAIPYGGREWMKSTVAKILHNTTYIGYFFYNKNKRIDLRQFESRDRAEWIRIETTPIVDIVIFNLAQDKLLRNKEILRKTAKRFYMLAGMVRCKDCEHAYSAQTVLGGRNRRVNDQVIYRHRISEGHCLNRQLSASTLESSAWEKIKVLLMDPVTLRQGYFDSLDQQKAAQARQRGLMEEYQRAAIKLDQRRQNLTRMYTDPDIFMSKGEYLANRKQIDDELAQVNQQIETLAGQLQDLPTPEEFETLEGFAQEVREELLQNGDDFSPEFKRRIFELLHLTVWINKAGEVRAAGWFGDKKGIFDGVLYTVSSHCGRQQEPPPALA
jgi:site-specific DNA recombinase